MTMPKITILTDPILWGNDVLEEGARRIARWLINAIRPNKSPLYHSKYRGHFAVTRSLVEGLRIIDADFIYNPRYRWHITDTVIVLAGVRTLRQAIKLKQNGVIRKLFAGPNVVVFSSDHDSILASDEIDAVITPSDWVIDLYLEDNPRLKNKIFSWAAGVDTDFWKPDGSFKRDRIVIFDKRQKGDEASRTKPYKEYLENLGWQVDTLTRSVTQEYTQAQSLELLRSSCLMIGFTVGSESQGIAWAEAWATDVPTLILRNNSNVWGGRRYSCSTAPYLNQKNGLFFDDLDDFKVQFAYWESHRDQFTPRAWTLENMSDEVCAAQLYNKAIEC